MKTMNLKMNDNTFAVDYEVVDNVLTFKTSKGQNAFQVLGENHFHVFEVTVKNDCVDTFVVNDLPRSIEASDTFKVNTVHDISVINGQHCYCIGFAHFKLYYTAFSYMSVETFIAYFTDTESTIIGALACEFSECKILVNEVVL